MNLPKVLIDIANRLNGVGAKAILVGGAVRDFVLQKNIKDFDIEVYNIASYNELASVLSEFGAVNLVGKSFGIVKLRIDNIEYDFSMPRLENKIAKGHKGFDIKVDSKLDFKTAAKRRDFTINAMGWDILEKKLLDPFLGLNDIKSKTLHIVDKSSFSEDPLRVYRAVQFGARFEFKLSKETFALCKELSNNGSLEELAKERIWEEFKKFLLKAKKPSIALELMRELGILNYFPELKALIGVKQDPKYHPEGDVWVHTLMVLDEASKLRIIDEKEDLILMLSALCHDFGKPKTTKLIDGRYRAFNHEKEGVEPTISFLKRLTNNKDLIKNVTKLVEYHLRPMQLYIGGAKASAIRRLALKVSIERLVRLAKADYFGRGGVQTSSFEAGDWLLARAKELSVLNRAPKKLVEGRDLIKLGLEPSIEFGKILQEVYNAQIDGAFKNKEEAIKWVEKILL